MVNVLIISLFYNGPCCKHLRAHSNKPKAISPGIKSCGFLLFLGIALEIAKNLAE